MTLALGAMAGLAVSMSLLRVNITGQSTWQFLIWNLFLALIPLGAAILFRYLTPREKVTIGRGFILLTLASVWLVFFPNAPYLVTDFIHINGRQYILLEAGQRVFNRDLLVWYDLVMIVLFVMAGLLAGFWSLFLMQKAVREGVNRPISWLFSLGVLFVGSFGIYLGRFIRWNSWDLLTSPVELFHSIFDSFHGEALGFTLIFFGFLVILYVNFYYWSFLSAREPRKPGGRDKS